MSNRWYHASIKQHDDTFKNGWNLSVFVKKAENGFVSIFDGYRLYNTLKAEQARELLVLGSVATEQTKIENDYIDLIMY